MLDFVPEKNLPETQKAIQKLFSKGQVEFETRRYTWKGKIECQFAGDRGFCRLMAKTNIPFDLVITDYQMPSMDRAEPGKKLRDHPVNQKINKLLFNHDGE